jgi:hypothetical protein
MGQLLKPRLIMKHIHCRGGDVGFPPQRPEFHARSGPTCGVLDRMVLGWIFSEYIGFSVSSFSTICAKFINHVIDAI